jgi:mono/diheme cytochrome c family protein
MKRSYAAVGLGAGLTVAAVLVWPQFKGREAIDPTDAIQVASGKELYARHCASCHGESLQGQPNWQVRKPNGELPAPPQDASGHTWHHTNEQLFAITKHGMARFAPPGYRTAMPAFIGTLSDADIRAVLAYIESTWPADIRHHHSHLEH